MNMLRPHDEWTIAHTHHPARRARPHGDLVPTTSPRVPGGRRRIAALAVVPALAFVTSCGSSDPETSAYCGAVEDAKPAFAALESGDPERLDQAFATFHDVAKNAPADLDDDWKVLDGAIADVETALEAAGLDFAAVAAGELPDGTDPAQLQAVLDGLEELASEQVASAANSIEAHAIDECDVELATS